MTAARILAFHDAELAPATSTVAALLWVDPALPACGGDVALRVWTPRGVAVDVVRRVAADAENLADTAVVLDEHTRAFALGHWSDRGPREYELCLEVPARDAGDAMLVAQIHVVGDGAVVADAAIAVSWTDADVSTHPTAAGSPLRTAAAGELTTGRSAAPTAVRAGHPDRDARCAECGQQPAHGDRFCEACGARLA